LTCLICNYFARETTTTSFEVLPFHGRELVRDFGGESGSRSLRIFSKLSAINRFGMPLSKECIENCVCRHIHPNMNKASMMRCTEAIKPVVRAQ